MMMMMRNTFALGSSSSAGGGAAAALLFCSRFAEGLSSAAAVAAGSDSKEVGQVAEHNVSGTPAGLEPTTVAGVSFPKDIRGTSALGIGDGFTDHTSKWMSLAGKSPMEYAREIKAIKVHSNIVACSGDAFQGLGHPIEYIRLDGTSLEEPAVCKYCGSKYYFAGH